MKFVLLICTFNIASAFSKPTTPTYSESVESDSVIEEILQEDNLVQSSEEKPAMLKRISKPLLYFDFLDEEFEKKKSPTKYSRVEVLNFLNQTYAGTRHRIYDAWLPAQIYENPEDFTTSIIFIQTLARHHYGNFSAARITLTMLDESEELPLPQEFYVKLSVEWEDDEMMTKIRLTHTQQISKDRKFVSFVLNEGLKKMLKRNLTKPNEISFNFSIYSYDVINGSAEEKRMEFGRIFDAQVERPVLMLFFTDYVPADNNYNKTLKRGKRSIYSSHSKRPSTRCQRKKFSPTPEELSWYNVISPRKLDLGYCAGNCPFPLEDRGYNFTAHTFLLDRYRHRYGHDLPNDFPFSECVPIKYKSINILESVDGEPDLLRKETIDEISVERCGCR